MKKDNGPFVADRSGCLFFRADDISGSLKAYSRLGARCACFAAARGFSERRSIAFLQKQHQIRGLHLARANPSDLATVARMTWLHWLSLTDQNWSIDLSRHRELYRLSMRWRRGTILPPAGTALHELMLFGYSPRSRALEELACFPSLSKITLIGGAVSSLGGIERLPNLHTLDLRLEGLRSLAGIERSSVKRHYLFGVPRGLNLSVLSRAVSIETLMICQQGSIPTVSFVKGMRKLRSVELLYTTVKDGDLTPLLRVRNVTIQRDV